jgi:DNA topoisomerase-6 subunit B
LLVVAQKKTAEADMKMDDRGRVIDEDDMEFGDNVLIVAPEDVNEQLLARVKTADVDAESEEQKKLF